MKTRTGFVSNSSSSSFIAYGATIPFDTVIPIVDTIAPGKLFEVYAPKLNKYYTDHNTKDFIPFTNDDTRFREVLTAVLPDGWPIEYYDIFNDIDLPLPMEMLYDDRRVFIGYMVDTEDIYRPRKVCGEIFKQDEMDQANAILHTINLTPDIIMGTRAC